MAKAGVDCPSCGRGLLDGEKKCRECGLPITAATLTRAVFSQGMARRASAGQAMAIREPTVEEINAAYAQELYERTNEFFSIIVPLRPLLSRIRQFFLG